MATAPLVEGDPSSISQWHVRARLGASAMSVVYLAESGGQYAAIKLLRHEDRSDRVATQRFAQELAATSGVRSSRVATVLDHDLGCGSPYIASQYVHALTLAEHVGLHGPLSPGQLEQFAKGLAEGIRDIASAGVVHRDIKPSNILVTPDGPVIIDFGIAAYCEGSSLTATGQVIGSPGWIAPELLTGAPADSGVDVYGWAATVQFAATGSGPFGTGPAQALMYRVANGSPQQHGIAGPLGAQVSRGLARQPSVRPSINDVLGALHTPISVRPDTHGRRTAAVVALVLVAVAFFGATTKVVLDRRANADSNEVVEASRLDRTLPTLDPSAGTIETIVPNNDADVVAGTTVSVPGTGGAGTATTAPTASSTSTSISEAIPIPTSTPVPTSTPQAAAGPIAAAHIDCVAGSDDNSGESPDQPWRTLSPLTTTEIEPGGVVSLLRGCRFDGPLAVPWSGRAGSPIAVTAYGDRSRPAPVLAVETDEPTVIVEVTGSYVTVSDIETVAVSTLKDSSCDNNPRGWVVGFGLMSGATHVELQEIKASGGYAGVFVAKGATDNRIADSEFSANTMLTPAVPGDEYDAGANGVLLHGDRNEVTNNSFEGNVACSNDGHMGSAVHIWGGSGNRVHHNRSTNDAHFGLIAAEAADNVLAYNLATGTSAEAIFVALNGGTTTGMTTIVNNTVYLRGAQSEGMVCFNGCDTSDLRFVNNVVWANKKTTFSENAVRDSNNLYWSDDGLPVVQGPFDMSLLADPGFTDQAGGDFVPNPCSPAVAAGTTSALNNIVLAPIDLGGTSPAGGRPVSIGAFEPAPGRRC